MLARRPRARCARTVREIDLFDADDRAWLRGRSAPQGRLNAGQKLNAIVTAAFAVLFAVTGFLLWYGERNTRFRFADALLVHDWLMYISFFLFLGHLYLSVIHPKTRHSLGASPVAGSTKAGRSNTTANGQSSSPRPPRGTASPRSSVLVMADSIEIRNAAPERQGQELWVPGLSARSDTRY